jgi:hypothetical protein
MFADGDPTVPAHSVRWAPVDGTICLQSGVSTHYGFRLFASLLGSAKKGVPSDQGEGREVRTKNNEALKKKKMSLARAAQTRSMGKGSGEKIKVDGWE